MFEKFTESTSAAVISLKASLQSAFAGSHKAAFTARVEYEVTQVRFSGLPISSDCRQTPFSKARASASVS